MLKLVVAQTWEAVAHPWKPMVPSGSKVGDRGEVGGGGREEQISSLPWQVCSGKLGKNIWQGVFVGYTTSQSLPSLPQCQRQLPN